MYGLPVSIDRPRSWPPGISFSETLISGPPFLPALVTPSMPQSCDLYLSFESSSASFLLFLRCKKKRTIVIPTTGTLRTISAFTIKDLSYVHDGKCNGDCGYLSRLCATGITVVGTCCAGASYKNAAGPFDHVNCLTCAARGANVVFITHMVVHMLVV